MTEAVENTDRELWREREGDFYAPSLHVTIHGGIGINVGGRVIVKTLGEWHSLAAAQPPAAVQSIGMRQHDVQTGWDRNTCARCGWVQPDTTAKRGTASPWEEWFPSWDAFEHFKRTGARAWVAGSPCDSNSDPKGEDPKGLSGEAMPARAGTASPNLGRITPSNDGGEGG